MKKGVLLHIHAKIHEDTERTENCRGTEKEGAIDKAE